MARKRLGKNIVVSVNGKPVGCARSGTVENTTSTVDTSSKCSVDEDTGVMFAENEPMMQSATITVDGLEPIKDVNGVPEEYSAKELTAFQLAQTLVDVSWVDGKNAGLAFYMKAWITTTSIDSPHDDSVTYSATLTSTGKISPVPLV